jgi:hypothetical protein
VNRGQKKHQSRIAKWFSTNHKPKYEKGCIEHKGLLSEVPLEQVMEMMGEEVLDFASYFVTAKDQAEELIWENRRLRAQLEYKQGEIDQLKLERSHIGLPL